MGKCAKSHGADVELAPNNLFVNLVDWTTARRAKELGSCKIVRTTAQMSSSRTQQERHVAGMSRSYCGTRRVTKPNRVQETRFRPYLRDGKATLNSSRRTGTHHVRVPPQTSSGLSEVTWRRVTIAVSRSSASACLGSGDLAWAMNWLKLNRFPLRHPVPSGTNDLFMSRLISSDASYRFGRTVMSSIPFQEAPGLQIQIGKHMSYSAEAPDGNGTPATWIFSVSRLVLQKTRVRREVHSRLHNYMQMGCVLLGSIAGLVSCLHRDYGAQRHIDTQHAGTRRPERFPRWDLDIDSCR
ncbi:hypothetical protein LIA77_00980 [Sarocladium implicatum]|nr:hypothetical protein LIA77_00980 [Sarocladium implicatum]